MWQKHEECAAYPYKWKQSNDNQLLVIIWLLCLKISWELKIQFDYQPDVYT